MQIDFPIEYIVLFLVVIIIAGEYCIVQVVVLPLWESGPMCSADVYVNSAWQPL